MTTHLTPEIDSQLQLLPPLESGDRLSRPEFERRYEAASHIRKAELIEGVVYVASPFKYSWIALTSKDTDCKERMAEAVALAPARVVTMGIL